MMLSRTIIAAALIATAPIGAVAKPGSHGHTVTGANGFATVDNGVASKLSARSNTAADTTPNIAFFDGATPPIAELQAFDAVVLDPAQGFDPAAHPLAHTAWIARTASDSDSASGASYSPNVFVNDRIVPLWQRGYRGFLLDSPSALAAAAAIHARFPDAKLIAGGADALHTLVTAAPPADVHLFYAAVSPSLVHEQRTTDGENGANPAGTADMVVGGDASRTTQAVPAAEAAQRLADARAFHRQTGIPVMSIDYCDEVDRQCARQTAAQVLALGIVPYVTSPARDVVGIGKIEVLPRTILVVQDAGSNQALDMSQGVRSLATPLNYLGYNVEYVDMSSPLPTDIRPDRYAGIVAWFQNDSVPDPQGWQNWITARINDHIPVAFFDHFGFDPSGMDSAGGADPLHMRRLDVDTLTGPVSVVNRDPMIGFEYDPKPDARDLLPLRSGPQSHPLLSLSANGTVVDPVALTSWGGYALSPYTVVWLGGIEQGRWALQPIDFLKAALHLQTMPSPSVTTENGRRLFMTHVDGDGFASRAEFPGPDYSGQALYDQIWTRFHVPMTLSVIEGEVGPDGLYPAISPRLEEIARKMFALPNIEIGSHTYSHPFEWEEVNNGNGARDDVAGGDTAFSLNIPGYQFSLDREIQGSIDYINSRLAPPGKKTVVLQWSGNCRPPAIAVRKVYEAGVANFNGGDTTITKSMNTWTAIAPIGVDKGPGAYQVYAPNQDENVYTNDWQGPFYGFARVLETFALTDAPLRFKPIDIYYHMYTGTKVASLHALNEIFTAVLKQPVMPVYVSEYIQKVQDWRTFAVAREVMLAGARAGNASGVGGHVDRGAWLVRGNGSIRELHWPSDSAPALTDASGLTGFTRGPDGTYIHFDNGTARFSIDSGASYASASNGLAYIAIANGFVRHFTRRANGMQFDFAGHYQPFVSLANAGSCRVTVNGAAVALQHDGDLMRFDTAASVERNMHYQTVKVDCGR